MSVTLEVIFISQKFGLFYGHFFNVTRAKRNMHIAWEKDLKKNVLRMRKNNLSVSND